MIANQHSSLTPLRKPLLQFVKGGGIVDHCGGRKVDHLAKTAWGHGGSYDWPSYDVDKLARDLVRLQPFGGMSVFGGDFHGCSRQLFAGFTGCEVDIDRQEKIILFVVDPS